MSAALALLSSLLWGSSDFLGGTLSRRRMAVAVVGGSQVCGLVAVLVVAAVTGAYDAPLDYLPWAVAAGLIGFSSLMRSTWAWRRQEGWWRPSPRWCCGAGGGWGSAGTARRAAAPWSFVVGCRGGAVLASGPELSGGAQPRPLLLAALAAVGFGVVLTLIAQGGRTARLLMTLAGMRATSTVVVALLALRTRSVGGLKTADLPILGVIGMGDAGANWAFAQASTGGYLSVVSVLGSLYPAVTVLLARVINGERMRPIQDVGVLATLVGVVLHCGRLSYLTSPTLRMLTRSGESRPSDRSRRPRHRRRTPPARN